MLNVLKIELLLHHILNKIIFNDYILTNFFIMRQLNKSSPLLGGAIFINLKQILSNFKILIVFNLKQLHLLTNIF